jgi:hypothetical protein
MHEYIFTRVPIHACINLEHTSDDLKEQQSNKREAGTLEKGKQELSPRMNP